MFVGSSLFPEKEIENEGIRALPILLLSSANYHEEMEARWKRGQIIIDSLCMTHTEINIQFVGRVLLFVEDYKKVTKREQYYSFLSFKLKIP